MVPTVLFFLFGAFVLFSAYFVVTTRKLFHSAMGLISVLLGVAGMYLLMDAQFLSAVQVTVYIGGIVVLIVFVILLVEDAQQKEFRHTARWRNGLVGTAAAALFGLMTYATLSFPFESAADSKSASVREIGRALLSPEKNGFVLPFEIISLILIAALIGSITIARASHGNGAEPESKP